MKKIRKGNDIVIRWTIRLGEEEPALEGRPLDIEIIDQQESIFHPSFEVVGNVILFTYYGVNHGILGNYKVVLYVNRGHEQQRVVDVCDAFQLVGCSCPTDYECEGIEDEEVEIESDLQFCGISVDEMWALLGRNTEQQIHPSHVQDALEEYTYDKQETDSRIATAKQQAIQTASEDATQKATAALNSAVQYTNTQLENYYTKAQVNTKLNDYIFSEMVEEV